MTAPSRREAQPRQTREQLIDAAVRHAVPQYALDTARKHFTDFEWGGRHAGAAGYFGCDFEKIRTVFRCLASANGEVA